MALKVGELFASFNLDDKDLDKSLASIEKKCEGLAKSMRKVGLGLTAAMTTPVVLAGKEILDATVSYESAFAGVRKTVDVTEAEFESLHKTLLDMSLVAPQSYESLAGIAEISGQLGVDKDNISKFTSVIADLGVATNLTNEEAASMLAQFANITGMDLSNIDRLGSVIVDLGNNTATTEKDIVEMMQRLAGAGSIVGLTDAQIAGLSATLTALGINAEAGGSAMSKVLASMQNSVLNGGEALKDFADVAGVSAKDFADAFKKDPITALDMVLTGLRKIHRKGGNVNEAIEKLGFKDVRITDMLKRLMGAEGQLTKNVQTANTAWTQNNALTNEAGKRYDTLESKMQMAKNAIRNTAASFGELYKNNRTIQSIVDGVKELAISFGNLDDGTKQTVMTIAGVAAAAGPLLLVGSKIVAIIGALATPAGLAGAAIVGLGIAFSALALDANKTTLSLKEVKSIVDGFDLKLNMEMGLLVEAKKEVDAFAESLKDLYKENKQTLLKVKLGMKLEGDEAKSFVAQAEKIINDGIKLIEDNQRQVNLTLMLTMSDSEAAKELQDNLFTPYFEQIEASAKEAGARARRALTSAMADGKLSAQEAAQIQSFMDMYMEEINRSMLNTDMKASVLRAKLEGGLLPADIKNIIKETYDRTKDAFETTKASGDQTIMMAYRAAIELGLDDAATKKHVETYKKELANTLASLKIESMGAYFNALNDDIVLPDLPSKIAEWGLDISDATGSIFDNIETLSIRDDINTKFSEIAGAMYEGMKPDTAHISEIVASYESLGLAIPQAIIDIQRRHDVLGALSEGTTGMFRLMRDDFLAQGKELSNVSQSEMQKWFSDLATFISTDMTLPDSMKNLWGHVMLQTFDQIDTELKPKLQAALQALGAESGKLFGMQLPQSLIDGINAKEITIEEAAKRIVELSKLSESDASSAKAANQTAGETSASGVATGIKNKSEEAATAAGTLADETVLETSTMPEEMALVGQEATAGITTAIADGTAPAVDAMNGLASEVVAKALFEMSAENGKTIGTAFSGGIVDGLNTNAALLSSTASIMASDVKSAASDMLSASAGQSIGSMFSQGLANGIRSGIGVIAAAAGAAAQTALQKAKSVLKIHSPSREAMWIGEMFGQGGAIGMLHTIPLLSSASEKISNAMLDSFYLKVPSRQRSYSTRSGVLEDSTLQGGARALDAIAVGTAIADRLIERNALHGDVYMDGSLVGEKVSDTVSQNIDSKSKGSSFGRVIGVGV